MTRRKKNIIAFVCVCFAGILAAQDNVPSREERIYDLSLIWKEMTYNFVYSETMHKVNIDSLYFAYLPKVEQVKNRYEYYRVLSAFMTHFNDGHTRILTNNRPDEPPAIECINFGEKIVVGNIAKSMADKIPVGSEIIMVNNIPVIEFLNDSVYSYISAANSHWKFDKAVSEMLFGMPQSTVKLTVKTSEGKQVEAEMIRGIKEDMFETVPFSPINIKILNDDIGYIHLTTCLMPYVQQIDSVFLSWVPQLKNCRGLILDLRGNRGGGNRAWYMIAACLITPSIKLQGTIESRKHIPMYSMFGRQGSAGHKGYYSGTVMEQIEITPPKTNIPERLQLYNQPLIVISNSFSGSATEHFLSLIKETGRATVIGTASAGVMSSPNFSPLSGGFEAMIAVGKYLSPDGTLTDTTGILPDIEVKRDYRAYMEGRDNVLERAIEELHNISLG